MSYPGPLLGAHVPIKGGLGASLRAGAAYGCECAQVFTGSPRQWRHPEPTEEQIRDFKRARAETGITQVISHDSYLINLIAVDPEIAEKSRQGLAGELARCGRYGIGLVVSHLASYKGRDPGECLVNLAAVVKEILAEAPSGVTLLMETTAGQGSSVNSRFEEIAMLLELTGSPANFGVCLDTCHVFAAGYEMRTEDAYGAMWAEFERLVGIDRLKAIHVNDSLKPFASRVDRHADIGQGEMGETPFRCLVNDARLAGIPATLETDAERHAENLARLKGYRK